jgi:hypothetical protein
MMVWVMVGVPVAATTDDEPEVSVLRAAELQPLSISEAVATAAVMVCANCVASEAFFISSSLRGAAVGCEF